MILILSRLLEKGSSIETKCSYVSLLVEVLLPKKLLKNLVSSEFLCMGWSKGRILGLNVAEGFHVGGLGKH